MGFWSNSRGHSNMAEEALLKWKQQLGGEEGKTAPAWKSDLWIKYNELNWDCLKKTKNFLCEIANGILVLKQFQWPSNFLRNYIPFSVEKGSLLQSCLEWSKPSFSTGGEQTHSRGFWLLSWKSTSSRVWNQCNRIIAPTNLRNLWEMPCQKRAKEKTLSW